MKQTKTKKARTSIIGSRKKRPVTEMNITSLIDILTILLVFLIKNVSLDTTNLLPSQKMEMPYSIATDELVKEGKVIPIQIYFDEILYGPDLTPIGTPDAFINDDEIRNATLAAMQHDTEQMLYNNPESPRCILIQADMGIPCRYITRVISVAGVAGFNHIYFSTLHKPGEISELRRL
ncbi:MAG: biopolymer transporter ExbD [Candidatus Cloacimonetes bacterium]|nr:biopolymer transporter ExbD [Candidatus Cloacimonadota bacterium]